MEDAASPNIKHEPSDTTSLGRIIHTVFMSESTSHQLDAYAAPTKNASVYFISVIII